MSRMSVATFLNIALGLMVAAPAALSAQATSFGPITLGRLPPDLPECKRLTGGYDRQGPCQVDNRTIGNIPYDGAEMIVSEICYSSSSPASNTSGGKLDARNCPVAEVLVNVADSQCKPVLRALKAKFGYPRFGTEILTNGFGAQWQHDTYDWARKNGDVIEYSVHDERDGGCTLVAETRERQAEIRAMTQQKIQF